MAVRRYALLAGAVAAVLVSVLAATISNGPVLGHQGASPTSTTHGPPPAAPIPTRPAPHVGVGHWIQLTGTVLLGIYAAALLALLVNARRRQRSAEVPAPPDGSQTFPDEKWGDPLAVDLEDAARELLEHLGEGSPRNAIVACWMGLHAATRRVGLEEPRSDTPAEYTMRAMCSLDLDRTAISDLGHLYREARFSVHEMTEEDRRRAGADLSLLADQLAERHAAPGPLVTDHGIDEQHLERSRS